jgi:WD40 repeat protein
VELATGGVLDLPQKPGVNARDFAFSPDSGRLAVRYDDQTVRVWNARTGAPAAPLFRAGPAPKVPWNSRLDLPVGSVLFSPEGHRLVTASTDGTIRLWDVATGRPLIAPLPGCQAVGAVQFSPDGRRLVTANWDQTARVWDTATGRQLAVVRAGSWVHFVAFSPDGRRVLTMSEAGLRVWEAGTGKAAGPLIPRPLEDNKGHWTGLVTPRPSFSPDGRWVLDSDRGQVWDPKTGGLVSFPKQQGLMIMNGWFSPEGRRLVTTASDFTLRVWDVASGAAALSPLKHAVAPVQAAFAPDGHRLLTFCQDGTVREWETAAAALRDVVLQHGDPTLVFRNYYTLDAY